MNTCPRRRRFLQYSAPRLAALPLLLLGQVAAARTNDELRAKLKYQATPFEGKSCSSCLEFLPTSPPGDHGGCKLLPDDDEILANGYCTLWNTL